MQHKRKGKPQYGTKNKGRGNFNRDRGNKPTHHIKPNPYQNKDTTQIVTQKFPISEEKQNVLCSFVILQNGNLDLLRNTLKIFSRENILSHIVISLHSSFFQIQHEIEKYFDKNKTTITIYTSESENELHNKAFVTKESDVFIITNSNIEPRQYATEILTKYILRNDCLASSPLVYNPLLEIQKYCMRFPTFLIHIKILFGSKAEKDRLYMMERGEGGYYKIHKIGLSISQIFAVNSQAFASIGLLPTTSDNTINKLRFYKKIAKNGITLHISNARCIENASLPSGRNIFLRLFYLLSNVF